MPGLNLHCAISKLRTGFGFEELHKWIDEANVVLEPDHRIERHSYNKEDEAYIREWWDREKGEGWGEKAVEEWLFHIALDNMLTAYRFAHKGGVRVIITSDGYMDFEPISDETNKMKENQEQELNYISFDIK